MYIKKYLISILLLLILILLGTVINAGTIEYQVSDFINVQQFPISYKCDAPLVNDEFGMPFCNSTLSPLSWTEDIPCIGKSLDFSQGGISDEILKSKVRGFNHYLYCFNEFYIKNPTPITISFSSDSLKGIDMDNKAIDLQILIKNRDIWNLWNGNVVNLQGNSQMTFGIFGVKENPKDRIEWGVNLSVNEKSYFKDPFWDGINGTLSYTSLVPDNHYVIDDFEDRVLGENWTSSASNEWENIFEESVQVESFQGLNIINATGGYDDGLFLYKNFNLTNFTYVTKAYVTDGGWRYAADPWARIINNTRFSPNTNTNPSYGYTTKYMWYAGPGTLKLRLTKVETNGTHHYKFTESVAEIGGANKWWFFNSTFKGNTIYANAGDAGDGAWLNKTNWTDINNSYPTGSFGFQTGSAQSSGVGTPLIDYIYFFELADNDYLDNAITNLSCPHIYTDTEGDAPKNATVFFYKDNILDTTLITTDYNRTNMNWTISIGGGTAGTWFCNATVCDENEDCANTQKSNEVTIIATNTPPTISSINITSDNGLNNTYSNLVGDYVYSDGESDPQVANETLWFNNSIMVPELTNRTLVASGNTTLGENWIFSAKVDDGTEWSNWYNSSSLTIVDHAPTIPVLNEPSNNSYFNSTLELNWTNSNDADGETITYRLEVDDEITFTAPLVYSNASIYEDAGGITGEEYVVSNLNLADDKTYYWRVLAMTTPANNSWSDIWQFTYAMFDIKFNVTDAFTRNDIKKINEIDCDNGFTVTNTPNQNPIIYTNGFVGTVTCTFSESGYYDELVTFTATQNNQQVDVGMTPIGGLTPSQASQLQYLFTCFNNDGSGDCWNYLDRIELNTKKLWNLTMRTNQSVITSEDVLSYVVNSTQNVTLNYTMTIPTKDGFGPGDFLPVRFHYWFLNDQNVTCYNQGGKPTGVEDPYCQPLTASIIGKIGDTLTFTVDLRPTGLPAGDYTLVREVDIDPNNIWIRYGQERLGTVSILEDGIIGGVHLEQSGGILPGIVQKTTELANAVTGDVITTKIEEMQEMILSLKEQLNAKGGTSIETNSVTGNLARDLVGRGSLLFTIGFFALITVAIGYFIGRKIGLNKS